MADLQVGASSAGSAVPIDVPARLGALAAELRTAADRPRSQNPQVADVIDQFATAVEAAADLPPSDIEEHLFALESALLANCLGALEESRRSSIEESARGDARATSATEEARERTFLALRDRLLREELGLPRLELDG